MRPEQDNENPRRAADERVEGRSPAPGAGPEESPQRCDQPLPASLAAVERRLRTDAEALSPPAGLRGVVLARVRRELAASSAAGAACGADAGAGVDAGASAGVDGCGRVRAQGRRGESRLVVLAAGLVGFLLLANAGLGVSIWRAGPRAQTPPEQVAATVEQLEALDLGLPPEELQRQSLLLNQAVRPLPLAPPAPPGGGQIRDLGALLLMPAGQ